MTRFSPLWMSALLLAGLVPAATAFAQTPGENKISAEAKITIIAPATLSINDASAAEGEDIEFTIKLDKKVEGGFTVTPKYTDGSAISVGVDADYTQNETPIAFTGAAGEEKKLKVATIEDSRVEADETFTVALVVSGNAAPIVVPDPATGTIANDDTPPTPSKPGAPTGLTATAAGQTTINLRWNAPPSNGSPITGYRIEVSSNAGTSWGDLMDNTRSTATTYSHTGLSAGTTRHYRVRAINSVGTGPPSKVASATTDDDSDDDPPATAPGAPTGLTAEAAGQTTINLSWTAPTNTGGAAITGYKIEVSPTGAVNTWTDLVANTGSTTTTYSHTGLSAGTTRHYRVRAINSVGPGPPSKVASATTAEDDDSDDDDPPDPPPPPPPANAPGAPTNLTARADGQTAIDLSWTAPTDDGGAPITGYWLQSRQDVGGWGNSTPLDIPPGLTHEDTGLQPGTRYCYRVDAGNRVGRSAWSNEDCATTDAPPSPTLSVNPTSLVMPTNDKRTFTASLDRDPASAVEIRSTPSSGLTGVSTSGNVTLSAGNLSKTVTVNSGSVPGSGEIQVRRASGGSVSGAPNVSLRVYARPAIEVDQRRFIVYRPSSSAVTVQFRVKLTEQPQQTETIEIIGASLAISTRTLTFSRTNYSTYQSVTVTVQTDTKPQSYGFTIKGDGNGDVASRPQVTVEVRERSVLSVQPPMVSLQQGASQDVTLTLTPANQHELVTVTATSPASGVTAESVTFAKKTSGAPSSQSATIRASLFAKLASASAPHDLVFSATGNGVENTVTVKVAVLYTKPQLCIGDQTGGTCTKSKPERIRRDRNREITADLTLNKLETPYPKTVGTQYAGPSDDAFCSTLSPCAAGWTSTSGGGGTATPTFSFNDIPANKAGVYDVWWTATFQSGERDSVKYKVTVEDPPAADVPLAFDPDRWDAKEIVQGETKTFSSFGLNKAPSQSITTKAVDPTCPGKPCPANRPRLASSVYTFTPDDYGPKTLTLTVPDDAPPGIYNLFLSTNRLNNPFSITIFVVEKLDVKPADIEIDPTELIIPAGESRTLRVRLNKNKRPVHMTGPVTLATSGLTASYFDGPDPRTLTFVRDTNAENAWEKWQDITIATDATTTKTEDHTLTLTAKGGGYVNIQRTLTVKTLGPPCKMEASAGQNLSLGGWRKPDAGKTGSVTVNPHTGTGVTPVEAVNMVTTGVGASVGSATFGAEYCGSCSITIASPTELSLSETDKVVPFTGTWAKEESGGFTLGTGDRITGLRGTTWNQVLQFGGTASSITGTTPVGDYEGLFQLMLSCTE